MSKWKNVVQNLNLRQYNAEQAEIALATLTDVFMKDANVSTYTIENGGEPIAIAAYTNKKDAKTIVYNLQTGMFSNIEPLSLLDDIALTTGDDGKGMGTEELSWRRKNLTNHVNLRKPAFLATKTTKKPLVLKREGGKPVIFTSVRTELTEDRAYDLYSEYNSSTGKLTWWCSIDDFDSLAKDWWSKVKKDTAVFEALAFLNSDIDGQLLSQWLLRYYGVDNMYNLLPSNPVDLSTINPDLNKEIMGLTSHMYNIKLRTYQGEGYGYPGQKGWAAWGDEPENAIEILDALTPTIIENTEKLEVAAWSS